MRRHHRSRRILDAGRAGRVAGPRRRCVPCDRGRSAGGREEGQVHAAYRGAAFHGAPDGGEVDVLSRITTITFQRDVQLGIEFPAINWYDGTTFIVRKSSNVRSVKDLDGANDLACSW